MVPHLYTYFLPCFRHLENGRRLGALASTVTGKSIFFVTLFLSSKPTQSFLLYLLCLEKIFNFCIILIFFSQFYRALGCYPLFC
jgi:hypothetical protein